MFISQVLKKVKNNSEGQVPLGTQDWCPLGFYRIYRIKDSAIKGIWLSVLSLSSIGSHVFLISRFSGTRRVSGSLQLTITFLP